MILIISKEQDESTIDIIRWLYHLNKKFIVLNNKELIEHISIDINTSKVLLTYNNTIIDFDEITTVWYRRGNFMLKDTLQLHNLVDEKIYSFLYKEKKDLFEYLHFLLNRKFSINNYNLKKVNKLIVLTLAKELELKIPNTFITNQKKVLEKQCANSPLITKPINNPVYFYGDTYWLPSYTTNIDDEALALIDTNFGISLFQENIKKTLEIRCYFIDGDFYAMAIFSQNDDKTKTDFRCYNNEKPNRTIPFKVPSVLENKLKILAKKLALTSCSFDLIYTPLKEFIFLEVNPIGQFGMVSYPCNYHLEEKIALKLSNYDLSQNSATITR